ncbi:unnamed protein product [Mytilus coruscus]|uniref:Uncharacterized protein n=1 Tax=Mytilus coruscus TaxID=42192 RepID=A0A6J8AMA4_MYTCO|nr:unnamed protein product [Mytilus coruscus]
MRSRRQSSVASVELAPLGEEKLLARRLASPCEKNPSNAQRLEPPLGSLYIQCMDMPLSSDSPLWVCTLPRVPCPKVGVAGQTKLVVETSLDATSIIETKQKVQEYNTETILGINNTESNTTKYNTESNTTIYNTESNTTIYNTETILGINNTESNTTIYNTESNTTIYNTETILGINNTESNTTIYNTESNTTIYNTETILEIKTEECKTESKQEINNELMQEMQTEPIPEVNTKPKTVYRTQEIKDRNISILQTDQSDGEIESKIRLTMERLSCLMWNSDITLCCFIIT